MSATASLCLHKGASRVTLDELRAMPTPQATGSWFPISHAKVVDVAVEKLQDEGYKVKQMDLGVYRHDGSRFFGVLKLESAIADGVGLAIGLRNSVDKSLRMSMCAGNSVFVCDNLAFSSEIVYNRKHTRNGLRDFRRNMEDGVYKLSSFVASEAQRIKTMQERPLTDDTALATILRSSIKGLLPFQRQEEVVAQWKNPACDWGGETAWRLLNAFTYVLKDAAQKNADKYAAKTMKLQTLILQAGQVVAG